jgi:hypothetical protein
VGGSPGDPYVRFLGKFLALPLRGYPVYYKLPTYLGKKLRYLPIWCIFEPPGGVSAEYLIGPKIEWGIWRYPFVADVVMIKPQSAIGAQQALYLLNHVVSTSDSAAGISQLR